MDGRGQHPDGEKRTPPEGFDGKFPEGMTPPEMSGGFGGGAGPAGEPSTEFYMNDMVNFFSGITAAQ
jgi:hypothetical protein